MKLSSSSFAFTLALLQLTNVSVAERDDRYYPNGVTNPALGSSMYWGDAHNVLSDLSKFDALYVKYHSCAWRESVDGDGGDNGGDESDTWYLGSVPSFRPNVAFSLYGTLKGHGHVGCMKKTFINSFHTTNGLESFTNALASAGDTNFQYINNDGDKNEEENNGADLVTSKCYGGEDEQENGGDDAYLGNGQKYNSNALSYGTGCSADGRFVLQSYNGQNCDPNAAGEVQDELEAFNTNLEYGGECVKIFDGDASVYNGEEEADAENMGTLALLMQSRACNIRDDSSSCPDPFGKLRGYAQELEYAVGSVERRAFLTETRAYRMAWSFFSVGGVSILAALAVFIYELVNDKRMSALGGSSSTSKRNRKSRSRSRSRSSKKVTPKKDSEKDYRSSRKDSKKHGGSRRGGSKYGGSRHGSSRKSVSQSPKVEANNSGSIKFPSISVPITSVPVYGTDMIESERRKMEDLEKKDSMCDEKFVPEICGIVKVAESSDVQDSYPEMQNSDDEAGDYYDEMQDEAPVGNVRKKKRGFFSKFLRRGRR